MNPSPLRVMVLSNSLNGGGAERFASGMLAALSAADMQPALALLRSDIAYPLADTVPVHVLGYGGPRDLIRTVWRLRRILDAVRPDLVLGVGSSVNVVAGLTLAGMRRAPAWIARVDTNLERRDLRLRKLLLGKLLRRSDCIVANSEGMRRQLMTVYPRFKSRITACGNPVAFQQFDSMADAPSVWRPGDDRPVVVTAGRAHGAKRWDILLDAFARVVKEREAHLVLCGDGPQMKALQDQAAGLNIGPCVHFLGQCDNPFAVMAGADLFVLSSEAEGLPNALIEAQGLGLCAVAARCDFGPEEIVIHGETGLLTDINDSLALAAAMEALLADETMRKRMGARARKKVRRQFDFAARNREWVSLIRQVARRRSKDMRGV